MKINECDNIGFQIPLFKVYWDENDIQEMMKVIRRGSHWAEGPEINEFEALVADYVGKKFAVAFNSGTSALHAVMFSYGIKKGDEIIVPSFTFISTANAPLFVGAKPIFAEIETKTFGLDIEDVKKKINHKTKAIIPVHFGGCPCFHIKALKEIAEDNSLILIEDAAEALGSKINNTMVGSYGDSAMFSFCQNKIVTTGEGGIIVTDDKKIYEKLRLIRSHGRLHAANYFFSANSGDYVTLGYNFRIPTVLAALGLSQMKKIDKIIEMRRNIAEIFTKKLKSNNMIKLPIAPSNFFHIYQMYTIQVNSGKKIRDELINHLSDAGISTKIYFNPIHLSNFYKDYLGYNHGDFPITENVSESVLSIPIYPKLNKNEIDFITRTINEFFKVKK